MENREITLADIFLDILSESQDKGAKLMAERIKAAIKSPEILQQWRSSLTMCES